MAKSNLFGRTAKEGTFFFGITTQLQPWWLSMVMVSTSISVQHIQSYCFYIFKTSCGFNFPQEHGRYTAHKTFLTEQTIPSTDIFFDATTREVVGLMATLRAASEVGFQVMDLFC